MDGRFGILIVDDDPEVRETLSELLGARGYVPAAASQGRTAVDLVEERPPAVALVDLVLGQMSGLEVMRRIKERSPETECIVLTGYGSRESAVEALNIGAYGFVEKPYDVDQLLLTIRRAIEKREVERALREAHKRYENLIESASDIIADMDADGKLVFVNTYGLRRLGYAKDEVAGRRFQDFVAPASRAEAVAAFEKAGSGDSVTGVEIALQARNGEMIPFELGSAPYFLGNRFSGGVAILREITERKRAEKALRESEERLRVMFESLVEGVAVTDLRGNMIEVNGALADMCAHGDKQQLVGKNVAEFIAPKDHGQLGDMRATTLRQGFAAVTEVKGVGVDGREFDAEVTSAVLRDDSGSPVGLFSVARDITDRKKAGRMLHQFEELLRNGFERAAVGMSLVAIDGRRLVVNRAYSEILGYSEQELVNEHVKGIVHPDELATDSMYARRMLAGETDRVQYERRMIHKLGHHVDCLASASLVRDHDGVPLYFIVQLQDITERKRAEAALRESEEKLRRMFESVTEGIGVTDLKGVIVDANDRVPEMYGYRSKDDILGRNAVEFAVEGDRERVVAEWRRTMERGAIRSVECDLVRADGSEFPGELSASVLRDASGTPVGFIGVTRDITERKRAAEHLRESEERYRSLTNNVLDSSMVGIFVLDYDFRVVWVNQAVERYFGLRRDGIIGKDKRHLIRERIQYAFEEPGKFAERVLATYDNNARVENFECHVLAAGEREERWLEHWSQPIRSGLFAGGRIEHYYDITERKRAEGALRESELRYRNLFESAPIGIVVAQDAELRIVNRKMVEVTGYSEEEMRAVPFMDFIHPDDRQLVVQRHTERLGGEYVPSAYPFRVIAKDGSTKCLEAHAVLISWEGRPATLVFLTDITERKRAEEDMLRHTKREQALHAVAAAVSQTLELDQMLGGALERVLEVMEADAGHIGLVDAETRAGSVRAHRGLSERFLGQVLGEIAGGERGHGWLEDREPAFDLPGTYSEPKRSNLLAAAAEEGLQSFVAVPLWHKDAFRGALVLASRSRRRYSTDDLELLKAVANEIAVGIENARLLEMTRELSVTDELTGLYNRRHFYEVLETEISRTRRYGRPFSLAIVDLDGFKEYNDKFGHTNGDAVLKSLAHALKSALRKVDTAFRYGGDEFAIILQGTDAERAKRAIDRIRSKWLQVPNADGVLLESPLGFSAGIAQFPENAETADGLVFLADTALYRSKRGGGYKSTLVSDLGTLAPDVLGRATLDQVYALAATVDARDPYTYGHSKRVARVSEMIGRAIGLSRDELATLHAAALLHDIGKVGVSDSILTKPGRPTEAEWNAIRKHPAEGARIVGYVKELASLVPMVRHHHEWYDGTGYPDGLSGEGIPLGARIISIADAYDTMTTKRTYREVVSQEEALDEVRRCSGSQFDPELVEAFCRAMDESTG